MAKTTTTRKSVKAAETPLVETPVAAAPIVETPAEPVAPPAPTLHLLPLCISRLAEHADVRGSSSRFALNGVLVEFKPDNTFTAVATDTKHLVHVEGQRGLPAACHLPARDGMVVSTQHPDAVRVRSVVLDLTMSMLTPRSDRDGFGQASDRERARQAGFDDHIVKPLELEHLKKILARLG